MKVTAAKAEILARVRTALHDAPRHEPTDPLSEPHETVSPLTETEQVQRFAERVSEYQATVRQAAGEVDAARAIAAACAQHEVARLLLAPDLPDAWIPYGVELVHDSDLSAAQLDAVDGVLTGCALAIADTGTIVLDSAARQGRRAITLVPDLHICVVETSQIVGCLPEAIARLGAAAREGRPLTFISGPSATSDIELTRIEGVHGPRRLEVILTAAERTR